MYARITTTQFSPYRLDEAISYIGRILIFEYEPAFLRRNLTLILVNQVLGF